MSNEQRPANDANTRSTPVHFAELPFPMKCRVFVGERYSGLSLPNKIVLWLVVMTAILAPLALAARPLLREWKQANTLRAARQYAKTGEVGAALKAYWRALNRSTNADDWREFARFADRNEVGNTVPLWSKVQELDPASLDGWTAAMEAAMRYGDATGALKIFQQAPADLAARPEMQIARGSALVLAGRIDAARATLGRALEPVPDDPKSRLALALLVLDAGDATQKLQARQSLETLTRDESEAVRIPALRALLRGYRAESLRVSGIEIARRIAEDPSTSLPFRLEALGALIDWNAPDLDTIVRTIGNHALEDETGATALVQYLIARHRGAVAQNWTRHLLAEGTPPQQVGRLQAEIALSDANWPAFLSGIEAAGAFATMPEVLPRLIDIAGGHSSDPEKALADWNSTLEAIVRPGMEIDLAAALAKRHGWDAGTAATLEYDANLRPGDAAPLRKLAAHYEQALDLRALQRTLERWTALEPGNFSAGNAALHTRLLLGAGDPADNLTASERFVAGDPGNPEFLTTHAMALYRAGRFRDAANVFERMRPDAANHPERALYRGLVYAEIGNSEEALREFARARQSVAGSFPEAATLLSYGERRAQSRLQGTTRPVPPGHATQPAQR